MLRCTVTIGVTLLYFYKKMYLFCKKLHPLTEKRNIMCSTLLPRFNNPKVDSQRSSQDFGRVDKLISDRVWDRLKDPSLFFFSVDRTETDFSIDWKADHTAVQRRCKMKRRESLQGDVCLSLKLYRRFIPISELFDKKFIKSLVKKDHIVIITRFTNRDNCLEITASLT